MAPRNDGFLGVRTAPSVEVQIWVHCRKTRTDNPEAGLPPDGEADRGRALLAGRVPAHLVCRGLRSDMILPGSMLVARRREGSDLRQLSWELKTPRRGEGPSLTLNSERRKEHSHVEDEAISGRGRLWPDL